MQHLQMSGLTQCSEMQNIFGQRAMSSTSQSRLPNLQNLSRNNSNNAINVGGKSPANSDLACIPGSEDLIIDLLVENNPILRQNSSKENLQLNAQLSGMGVVPAESARTNFPLAQQNNQLPSQQQMKIGIRKFEKNLVNTKRQANSQSRACLQVLPENTSIVNQIIQKRRKPQTRGPAVHTKDEYKLVAQIIHFALSRRNKQTQPLFSTDTQQQVLRAKQMELRRHNSTQGQLQPSRDRNNSSAAFDSQTSDQNQKTGRSLSAKRDQNTLISFGGQQSLRNQKQNKHHGSISSRLNVSDQQRHHENSQSLDGNSALSFGIRHQQLSTLSRGSAPGFGQQSSNLNLQKEIDLRAEEILDAYCVIMRKADPKINLDKEYSVYNLLSKLSHIVSNQPNTTWSKALELHFNHNIFKAKSIRVSQNFVFRKFFCRWLETYLVTQSNTSKVQFPPNDTQNESRQDEPVHSYEDQMQSESTQEVFIMNEDASQQQEITNRLVGSSFGIRNHNPYTKATGMSLLTNESDPLSFRKVMGQPIVVESARLQQHNVAGPQGSQAGLMTSQYSEVMAGRPHYQPEKPFLIQVPSQETLMQECQDTIEGACSPTSQKPPEMMIMPQFHQPNYSFGSTQQNPMQIQQQQHQNFMLFQQQQQLESSDMQKAIVTLLSQRTMNETLTEAFQQTLQADQQSNQIGYSQQSQDELNGGHGSFGQHQKKSLTQLVKQMQMQSQNDPAGGVQHRVKKMAERLQHRRSSGADGSHSPHRGELVTTPSVEQLDQYSEKPSSNKFKRQKNGKGTITTDHQKSMESFQSVAPQRQEDLRRGLRKAKRAIQNVRQRVSRGFLRFTYTDEWLAEAFQRWRDSMPEEDEIPVKQMVQQQQILSEEDEEEALALVDKMLMAMQFRQNRLKIRCFSAVLLYWQRSRLMSQMSEQMEVQRQMKVVHKTLFVWHRRFKERQQRRSRLDIADGYFQYRLMSHAFSGWTGFMKSAAEEQSELFQSNRMAYWAGKFFAESSQLEPEYREGETGIESINDRLLTKQVFNQLKGNYERIREFKGRMAEKMLRTALLEFQLVAQRQRQVRGILTTHFREKTRTLAGSVLTNWAVYARKRNKVTQESFVMAIKRGGKTKKLIWKVLVRNAKARRTERQEVQFASIFFYQLIMKRSMKGLRLHKIASQAKSAVTANSRATLQKLKLQQVYRAMQETTQKQRQLKANEAKFSNEDHVKYLKSRMLSLWQEGLANKKLTETFQHKKLQEMALNRLRIGINHICWNRQIVEQKRTERTHILKVSLFRSLETHKNEQQRLRTLYLTQFASVNGRLKQLIFGELKSYSTRKRALGEKATQLAIQMAHKRRLACIRELRVYAEEKIRLRMATQRGQQALKIRVLKSMAEACRKQAQVNDTFSRVTTEHYKTLCKGLLQDWKNLTIEKVQRRDSLLERQKKYQARRFFGKLRLITQIGHVKRDVMGKLDAFRHNRLKQRTIESWREYLVGDDCAKLKSARKLRAKQLRRKGISALKICAQLGQKCKFFQQRHATQMKQQFMEKWLGQIDRLNRHRSIFSELDVVLKQKVYRALKAHWARRQIKRAQYEQCVLLRRHFLKETAMNAWLDFISRAEEKRQLESRKGQLADNIYLATIMHHWLQKAKKGHSVRAIGFLVERQHKRLTQARALQTMRIEFHKQCFVDQVNRKRSILQVQDIFTALREHTNARRSRRELNETRIQILVLQRKRKVFQTLKMQHFLSKIAKPPLLNAGNRYAQVTQTPTLESRRQSRSRSRSNNQGNSSHSQNKFSHQGPKGLALSLSNLSQKAPTIPTTPVNFTSNHKMNQSVGSAGGARYRYAMEGAQGFGAMSGRDDELH